MATRKGGEGLASLFVFLMNMPSHFIFGTAQTFLHRIIAATRRGRFPLLLGLAFVLTSTPGVRGAIVVQDYDAARHDRFQNDSQFIGNSYDWSGVGRGSGWATLISQTNFLSAKHLRPPNGSSVRFYETNDPAGPFVERTVVSGMQIAGTDLWLGTLSDDVGPNVNVYPIFSPRQNRFDNQTLYVFGKSGGDISGAAETDVRLGRNTIDTVLRDFASNTLKRSQGDVFLFDYDASGGVGADEARVRGGDSGAPSFVIVDGQPQLVGIHWFQYSGANGVMGSGDSLVSSYLYEIDLAIEASAGRSEAIDATNVPEPSTIVLIGLLLAVVSCRSLVTRRRKVS